MHVFLFHWLKYIFSDSNSMHQNGLEKFSSGQSRPIPPVDRSAMESQLTQHQQHERQTKTQQYPRQHELLTADPWLNQNANHRPHRSQGDPFTTAMSESASSEQFYSLDLTSSFASSAMSASMEAPLGSMSREGGQTHHQHQQELLQPDGRKVGVWQGGIVHRLNRRGEEDIRLHEGVGLQQLSSSPSHAKCDPFLPPYSAHPTPRATDHTPSSPSGNMWSRSPPLPTSARHQQLKSQTFFKFSLTLNGVTMALLEADPAHTYTTRLSEQTAYSSNKVFTVAPPTCVDEGGLDPVRYFELVTELMAEGVNWHQYQAHQKQLAQILPVNHLL